MMRVLWFSNNPAAGDELVGRNGTGGWIKSLDKAIQDKVDLHIAFYNRLYPRSFVVGKTTYHQLAPYDTKSLIARRIKMMLGVNPDLPGWLDLIDKVKPDIIHVHGTENPWILLASHTDVPVLLSVQAILTVMNSKYFSGISKSDLPLASKYRSLYRGFLKAGRIERDNLKYIRYVMGRTDWDRRVYSVIAPHARYFYGGEILRDGFYNFRWMPKDHKNSPLTVHTTSGPLLFKGLETICMSVEILAEAGLDVEWNVAGVGENSDIVRIVKRKLGRKYPAKGICFCGSLNEDDLIRKMLCADIYVSPSHQDNSPNALCEAAILGMPCISTFAGGSGSLLRDGESGILVQDGDPWALAGAVMELANDKDLARRLGEKARTDALERHGRDRVVSHVMDAYQAILKDSKK